MFKLHGLGGFVILVAVLVGLWIGLGRTAMQVQKENATNAYSIEGESDKKLVAETVETVASTTTAAPTTTEAPKPEEVAAVAEETKPVEVAEVAPETKPVEVAAVAKTPEAAGNAELGKGKYAVCAGCHGANGEGNTALNAPKLAGQQEWYVSRQIKNFQKGIRGTHPEDTFGIQMKPMAATLATEDDIAQVSAYIASLQAAPSPKSLDGDSAAGQAKYALCLACHGADGKGNVALNAPQVAGQQDWYIQRQLKNFKAGIRGTHAEDSYGSQMRGMTLALSDADMVNLAVYLAELK